ncbi:hypothetical protein Saro_2990 [Novosphingobium aromaticivorans DSM 12444]|uniref:Uncharacterized protein n=1 Tax=Novosphingobium aromaticivorans (strain ATCC 700278 / DSM 12444 / CCUG 56034 / CIP 105152 / NBRC 16084 / F199) TaxID=279238 RepID=Q2G3Z8_NOVAD|nr:hypothetical protein [Novosphingobium aromaticivorans]ABD27425.1 hypothetical protein Saro_2990 [Novosphingobium aromaticivorans DSM 12444]SCY69092.1 hypothetical protein SAMN05660666_02493 [Novosphingobium aromaticivorans]
MNSFNDIVRDLDGVIVTGANVYVYDSSGGLASLFESDGTTPKANPLVSDALGEIEAWTEDGFYSLEYFWNGRKRLIRSNVLIGTAPLDTAVISAAGYATALEVGTAGGWYDSLAAGAADPAVAEGDGYFYLTGSRFYIGQKVGGVGVQKAEFLTTASGLIGMVTGTPLGPINGLSPAADKLPYYTGATTASLADLTAQARTFLAAATAADQQAAIGVSAFIRGLLDDIDAATARATLGVVPGTDVQAYDGDLAAIAALTTTSFGRSLLTMADAAAARSAIGANGSPTVAGSSGTGWAITLGGGIVITVKDITVAAGSTTSQTYGNGHTYSVFARAWIAGDDATGDVSVTVASATSGLSAASVRSNASGSVTVTLFSIGQ